MARTHWTASDGHCLYRSFLMAYMGQATDEDVWQLRRRVADKMSTKRTPTSLDRVRGAMIELAGTFHHNFKSWSTLLNFFFKELFQVL